MTSMTGKQQQQLIDWLKDDPKLMRLASLVGTDSKEPEVKLAVYISEIFRFCVSVESELVMMDDDVCFELVEEGTV